MEEVAAGQAGGNRRPAARVRRQRRAADTTGAGEGGNRPAADIARPEDEEDETDDKYLERISVPLLVCSTLLVLTKVKPFVVHPPAWLSRAREAAAAGEPELLAARLYEFLTAVSVGNDAAVALELCLFDFKVVSAGRALTAITRFIVVGILSSVAALAAAVVAGSGDWHDATAALLPHLPAASAAASFVFGKLKELVREMFRG